MKLKFLYLFIFIGAIFAFSACSDDIELPDPKTYESIAIVYWMGDNGLSSAADADIKEMVAGKDKIPANSKIIIYADRQNKTPVIYELDAQNGLKVWKEFTQEEDCTDSLTLLTNLRTIAKNFPQNHHLKSLTVKIIRLPSGALEMTRSIPALTISLRHIRQGSA